MQAKSATAFSELTNATSTVSPLERVSSFSSLSFSRELKFYLIRQNKVKSNTDQVIES